MPRIKHTLPTLEWTMRLCTPFGTVSRARALTESTTTARQVSSPTRALAPRITGSTWYLNHDLDRSGPVESTIQAGAYSAIHGHPVQVSLANGIELRLDA